MKYTAKRDLIYNNPNAAKALEKNQLSLLVDAFATEMKKVLHEKVDDGFCLWDNESVKTLLDLRTDLASAGKRAHLNPVHVANLAAFIWNRDNA